MKGYSASILPVFKIAAAAGFQNLTAELVEYRPNNVFILINNQGAWSLGCYGNPDIFAPNIDRLASEGIRFARALNSNPVSSLARATLLTGLILSQHGVHCYINNKNMIGTEAFRKAQLFFNKYVEPKYDLWKESRSKARRLIN